MEISKHFDSKKAVELGSADISLEPTYRFIITEFHYTRE